MKQILTFAILLFSLTTFGQKVSEVMGQQMTSEKWNEEAKTNIRLLPKYGHIPKTEEQKNADNEFIETTVKQFPTKRKASDHLIELGFKYLYSDIKTAMYRFNQAYLLDSTNTDIYWGYGGIYMTLGDLENAQKQYSEGLTINSQNTHLLTDYGTYFMSQYYGLQPLDDKKALIHLDSAIIYLTKSFQLDKADPNTSFKLSICYYQKKDCINAWKYYNECKSVGGQPITEDFTNALTEQCKTK
jgi:tetratricopeptide (TPR) repeat protein